MVVPEEGLEVVGVRAKWKDETRDFTPWLARNLDMLSEVTGLKLKCIKEEVPVGPYFLDILAENADTGERVAIENQLEETDHTHLGQVLTYAAGTGAKLAIWVAPEFVYEHAQALHRLNEWKGSDIRFYGLKVEAVRARAGSELQARFHKVVYPGGWNKGITLQSLEMPLTTRRYYDFFQPLITEMLQVEFAEKVVQYFDRTGRFFPSRVHQGVGYAASLEGKNDAWVIFNIRMENREQTKRVFDGLQADHQQIESSIATYPKPEWHWLRHNHQDFSSICIRKDGSIDDPPDRLEETRAWMLDMLPKLKEVFEPRLQKLLN